MKYYSAIDQNGREVLVQTQAEAKALNKDYSVVEVPSDKDNLMAFIQMLMDAAQAPKVAITEHDLVVQARSEPVKPNYTEISIAIDEAWEKLPLSRKLHFAASAMEDARTQLIKEVKNEGSAPGGPHQSCSDRSEQDS